MDFIALRKGDIIQATDYVATDISFHVVGDTASVGHSWNKTAYFPMYRKTSGTGAVRTPNSAMVPCNCWVVDSRGGKPCVQGFGGKCGAVACRIAQHQ